MLIYIVEDDKNISEIECYALKNSGYDVLSFESGKEFYEALKKKTPQLVILDIMLPGEDGLSILTYLRGNTNTKKIPVIMVTAKSSEIDKVKGLDGGADDYITKPFGVMELVSRVRALFRRAELKEEVTKLCYETILLDSERHIVTVQGELCELTYKEFELLKYLMSNANIVLSRDKIMERVWGFDYEGETRTVDMHIKTLRQKLKSAGNQIKTVRNVGYKIGE